MKQYVVKKDIWQFQKIFNDTTFVISSFRTGKSALTSGNGRRNKKAFHRVVTRYAASFNFRLFAIEKYLEFLWNESIVWRNKKLCREVEFCNLFQRICKAFFKPDTNFDCRKERNKIWLYNQFKIVGLGLWRLKQNEKRSFHFKFSLLKSYDLS